jgi:hypothetical protein
MTVDNVIGLLAESSTRYIQNQKERFRCLPVFDTYPRTADRQGSLMGDKEEG